MLAVFFVCAFCCPAAIEFCVILVICRGYLLDTAPGGLIYSLNNVWPRQALVPPSPLFSPASAPSCVMIFYK